MTETEVFELASPYFRLPRELYDNINVEDVVNRALDFINLNTGGGQVIVNDLSYTVRPWTITTIRQDNYLFKVFLQVVAEIANIVISSEYSIVDGVSEFPISTDFRGVRSSAEDRLKELGDLLQEKYVQVAMFVRRW